jgi:Trypsin-like peptidase domain
MTDDVTFLDTALPSPITEFVVQITSNLKNEDHYASGTGVIIAQHLAFAARHVLQEHWVRHHKESFPWSGQAAGRFSFILAQLVGDSLNLWTVTRIWAAAHTDIVVLLLTPLSEGARAYKFHRLRFDLLPPKVGEPIRAFGYSESRIEASAPQEFTLTQRPVTTRGRVMEVHHLLRDEVTMPFPCFRTNARFDGGMSGGPVFNKEGRLCGLICSSYPPFMPDEDHASYAVSLWPAMSIQMDVDRAGHPSGSVYPMFDLIHDNVLAAVNADRVTLGPLGDDNTRSVSLTLPHRHELRISEAKSGIEKG